jgi:hypothetical protein
VISVRFEGARLQPRRQFHKINAALAAEANYPRQNISPTTDLQETIFEK